MDGSITLTARQRNVLLDWYRKDPDPAIRLRAHILLLLAAGHPWSLITLVLFCSSATIARWKHRFQSGGLAALREEQRGRPAVLGQSWIALAASYVRCRRPLEFGFLRSRWCCATLVLVLLEIHRVKVSAETVRRWLHAANLVWRRPRPTLDPEDPDYARKMREIRAVLRDLSDEETAVFSDEVDINSNPKLGCCWMERGQQATVATPGTNHKRYLAGSMHWRTGQLFTTEGTSRNAELFCLHLDELRRRLRHYRKIHVICDNLKTHKPEQCKKVAEYLQRWGRSHRAAFPAHLRSGDQPHRAGLVAPARGDHPQPPLQRHRRTGRSGDAVDCDERTFPVRGPCLREAPREDQPMIHFRDWWELFSLFVFHDGGVRRGTA